MRETGVVWRSAALLALVGGWWLGSRSSRARQELQRQLAARTRSLGATSRIVLTLAAAEDLDQAFREILPMVGTLVGADAVIFCRLDSGTGLLVSQGGHPQTLHCPPDMPLAQAAFGEVLRRSGAWIDTALRPDAVQADVAYLARQGFRSRAVLPVKMRNGEVVAVINLVSRQPDAYRAAHLTAIAPIVEQLGMAIDRDQLLRDTELRRRDAEELARLAAACAQSIRMEDVAPLVLQTMKDTFAASRADLWMLDESETMAVCVASEGWRANKAVGVRFGLAEGSLHRLRLAKLMEGVPVFLASRADMQLNAALLATLEVESGCFLPMVSNGRLIGAVFLAYCHPDETFPMARLGHALAITAQVAAAVANARLIDQLERTLERLQAVQEQLIRSERLSALGQLASFVSHEIKNRFNVIMTAASLAEMIATRNGSPERIKQTMATIKKEVDRGNDLMLRLLRYAKPQAPTYAMVSLPQILNSALLTARRANVEIVRLLPDDLPQVPGDPASLEQVFLNLIINALQAMPGGGTLTVSASVQPPWLEVRVSDTGAGMSEETQAHLFQPFFTTKAQGTGLGLVITRQIVDAHKGAVSCESTPGRGTTFTIRLPLQTAGQMPPPDIRPTEAGPEKRAV